MVDPGAPSVRRVVTRSRSKMIDMAGGIGRRLGLLTGTKGSSSDEDAAAEQHTLGAACPGGRERWSQEFGPVAKLWRLTKD